MLVVSRLPKEKSSRSGSERFGMLSILASSSSSVGLSRVAMLDCRVQISLGEREGKALVMEDKPDGEVT